MKVSTLLNWKAVVALVAGAVLAGGVAVASDSSSIADRIKPSGQVRLASEAGQQSASAAQSGGTRSGEAVYNQACAACHAGGVLGAPRKNNAGDWEDRLPQGMAVLLEHSINGFNAMPPRGGCGNCSDEEIEAAIEHMIAGL